MTLPVAPIVLPKDLQGQPNGNLDPSLLIPLHERGSLHHLAARAWRALTAEAGKNGLPLTFTYGGMYRPYTDQESLFRQRYTTSYIAGRPRKWWNNQWWYQRPNTAVAATPGTSNHGLGLAIDTAFDTDPRDGLGPDDAAAIAAHPKFAWFRDNIARFGFSFELESEPWHIRYVAGDAIPAAVKAFEDATNTKPFDPANGKWGDFPTRKKRAAKLGDKGDRVSYLKGVLKLKLGQDIKNVNRDFSEGTEKAVRNVQKFFNLPVDGWVGPTTWKVIDWASQQP